MLCKFEDIVINSIAKRKPTDDDMPSYIGLEHLDAGDLRVTRYGSKVPIKGDKLFMTKGDVLFGRRNTYLRRAAIAPHDGLFSAHGMILRPREEVIAREFLPLFISSDYFFDTAIRISVGSISPTVNWGTLKELTFDLPSLDEQQRLASILWACIETRNTYKELLAITEQLVKSRFVEMFGDPVTNPMGWEVKPLSDIIIHANNGMSRRGNDEYGSIVLRLVELQDGHIDYTKPNRIQLDDAEKVRYFLKDGDFLFARVNGNPDYVGRCAVFADIGEPVYHNDHIIRVRFNSDLLNGTYADELLNSSYGKREMKDKIKTSAGQYTINQAGIGAIKIPLPPSKLQNRFADFVCQADKSKFALQQTIDELEATYKSLLRENLG